MDQTKSDHQNKNKTGIVLCTVHKTTAAQNESQCNYNGNKAVQYTVGVYSDPSLYRTANIQPISPAVIHLSKEKVNESNGKSMKAWKNNCRAIADRNLQKRYSVYFVSKNK